MHHDPVPFNIRVFTQFAREGAYDIEALFAAVATMENITSVTQDPDPDRYVLGEQWVMCSPDMEFLQVNISQIAKGELWLFMYAQESSIVSNCTDGSLAYASTCLYEDTTNTPLMGFINVCPQLNLPSAFHNTGDRERQFQYNYRVFLHEIIHSMGMIYPVLDTMTGITLASGWVSIISFPAVQWARDYFDCPHIMGVPFVDGHWDPFFIGEEELMTACIPENAVLSPATIAFLDGVGPYKMLSQNMGFFDIIRHTDNHPGQGCRFVRVQECGMFAADGITIQDCLEKCVVPGTMVITPAAFLHTNVALPEYPGPDNTLYPETGVQRSSAARLGHSASCSLKIFIAATIAVAIALSPAIPRYFEK